MFLICLYQGLRRGEVLALTAEDIDFEKKTITINKAINQHNELDTTKNTQSIRIIPLFENTSEILNKYKNTTGRIFTNHYNHYNKIWLKLMHEHFPGKTYKIHSLRHTFITKCQEANVPLHIIQKWVGHSPGSAVTSRVYTHARDAEEQKNIDVLNGKLHSNCTHF